MNTSLLHADNTAPANRVVQSVGSTDVDNSKSLINSDEAVPIGEHMRCTDCMVDIDEDDVKVIYPDSENDPVRIIPCNANNMRDVNTSDDTSKNEPKYFKNMNGSDTDNDVEGASTGNAVQRTIDHRCQANDGDGCYLASTDHRKIVSQYFGRNKRCTQLLADRLWLVWCRKHYQQRRYNLQQEGTWHLKKLELIRLQIQQFQDLTDIDGWHITLHKTEQILLDRENAAAATPGAEHPGSPVWERFLEPLLGCNKTYEQLYAVLHVIEAEFQTTAFLARDNKNKDMPAIEFLPSFPKQIANKPMARPKNRAFIPHVKAKGKPLTSDSASQTVAPEFIDRTATLDITPTIDRVPLSPLPRCKRKASSPIPPEEVSSKHVSYSSSGQTDTSPSFTVTDLSSHRKHQTSSPSPLTNLVAEHPTKRRRLMRGIDRAATLDITATIDTVPVSPSPHCERKASSPMPPQEASSRHVSPFSSSRPDTAPSVAAADAVLSSLSSHRKRRLPSPSPLTDLVAERPTKRRRLMRGIRPKMVYTRTEETEE